MTRRSRARQLLIDDSWRIAVRPERAFAAQEARARDRWSSSLKSLEFEKLSVTDVRREIDRQHQRVHEGKRAALRTAQDHAVLLDATAIWIAGLPADVRPIALARTSVSWAVIMGPSSSLTNATV